MKGISSRLSRQGGLSEEVVLVQKPESWEEARPMEKVRNVFQAEGPQVQGP